MRAWLPLFCVAASWSGTGCSAALTQSVTVASVLDSEPGSAFRRGILTQTGAASTGGAPGRFDLAVDLSGEDTRLCVTSGVVSDCDGWDGGAWSAHDRTVVPVDLPGAIADARSEAFLRRYGWRDPDQRQTMRPLGLRVADGHQQVGVTVEPEGGNAIQLWFDRKSHRLSEAVVDADMGQVSVTFSDWRRIGTADFAFRRERRDATGQTTILATESASIVPRARLARPPDMKIGKLVGTGVVRFQFDHGDRGHIVVNAAIEGHSVNLVFDTGAATYLTPEVAKHLGLHIAGGLDIGGVGETSFAGGFARLATLQIGPARLDNSSAIVAALPEAATHPRAGLEIAGLAGFEFLHAFRTTIDYGDRTLAFERCGAESPLRSIAVPYKSDGQSFFVEAAIEGRPGWFRLDTGDAGTVTLFATFAKLNGFRGDGVVKSAGEAGGDLSTSPIHIRALSLADQTFRSIDGDISAQKAGAFASKSNAGNLGAGLLSCFRLTIDPDLHEIAFVPLSTKSWPRACLLGSVVP